jgi:solute carrier family 38 (sodium-coupled neutral amino acid transporter), member 11
MLLLVMLVIFPLSLFRGMRALEHVSSAGMAILTLLFAVLTVDAAMGGFRGVTSGDVPLWAFNARSGHVADAFALLGFSFYLHPLMMPMLQEVPPGSQGVKIMSDSVTFVIMGVAFFTYSYIGVMGAAAFGSDTQGDIMMNTLLQNSVASAILAVAVLIYLSSCIPPLVLSLRCYLDFIIAGPRAGFKWSRFLTLTVLIIAMPVLLAWHNPSLSERAFALTGASGVCIVCYVIPVLTHFKLLFFREKGEEQSERTSGLQDALERLLDGEEIGTAPIREYGKRPETLWEYIGTVCLPVLVLFIGAGLSAVSLYDSLIS